MPADVKSMSYVDNDNLQFTGVPWHGLGKAHDGWLTDDQVKDEIGFEVVTAPLYRKNAAGFFVEVDDAQETVRVDSDSHIGTVGRSYVPYCGDELVELGSILVDDWGAKWDTAAVLGDNDLIFATLRLDVVGDGTREGGIILPDNSTAYRWLLLASGHKGNHGITGDEVCVRTVCRNTFEAGRAGAKTSWAVRHIGDVKTNAREQAERTMSFVTKRAREFEEWNAKLAEVDFALKEWDDFAAEVFPVKEGDETRKERERAIAKAEGIIPTEPGEVVVVTRGEKNTIDRRKAAKDNWLNSDTVPEDLRFTRWGVLQGVSEYVEHKQDYQWKSSSARPAERALRNNLLGGPAQTARKNAERVLARGL